jgi:hypothetical protein
MFYFIKNQKILKMLFGMLIALYIRMVNKMIKNCLKGFVFIASILLPVALFAGPLPVDLGRACGFAALDGSGFTNTGNTVLNGDLGSFPTISETGLSTLTINGTDQAGDIYTQNAKTDLTAAYLDGSGRTVTATLAAELGGTTLTAGVYNTTAAFDITGTLTLDGGGDTNSVFILIAASTLTTADFSAVSLINGAQAGNVFWIIGSSASLGASTVFNGTIIAQDTITLVTNGSVAGRLLAINGQVILDTNTVGLANLCGMATATFTTTGTLTPTVTMTETPTAILTVTPSTTETLTVTGTNTATATETQNITQTTTPSITETATETGTGTNTATATETQNITQTITPSITETATETGTGTNTATATETQNVTKTITPSITETATETGTGTNTATATETQNITQTTTPSITETATETGTGTNTATATETQNITQTTTPSITETATETGTGTNTATATETQNITQTITPSITETLTETGTGTNTATATETQNITQTITPSITETLTETGTGTNTATATETQNITQTITPSITETATETGTGTNTATATETQNITQTITPSITQTLSLTLTTTNTVTPSATVIQTSSVTPTITPSLTGTMTPVNGVDLGTSGNYAVLSSTFTRNGGITAITGDLGYTTLSGGGSHTVNGNTYTPAPPQSGLDQAAALVSLDNYGCTFSFADGAVDLASDTTHGLTGIYTPGVYCVNGAMSISGGAIITLNGKGIYIFRSTGAFTSSDNSKVVLTGGADACDIYWTPGQAVTLGADTVFVGTIIDASGITAGNNTAWTGRALAFGGTVTMDTDSIALPVCGINGTLTNTPSATVTETLTLTVSATLTETETFSPTQTLTTLYTFTPTATATTVLIATATASPTFIQTAVVSVSKTYPNPINPLIQDLNVVFILNGYSENVKMLIYTPAFRLVRDIEIGTVPAGKNIAVIPGSKLRGFARGIYYYSVIFKTDGGSETKCSIEKLEILY